MQYIPDSVPKRRGRILLMVVVFISIATSDLWAKPDSYTMPPATRALLQELNAGESVTEDFLISFCKDTDVTRLLDRMEPLYIPIGDFAVRILQNTEGLSLSVLRRGNHWVNTAILVRESKHLPLNEVESVLMTEFSAQVTQLQFWKAFHATLEEHPF